jgi:hypothetical protein
VRSAWFRRCAAHRAFGSGWLCVVIVASVTIVEHLSRALRMSRETLVASVAIVEHLSRALRMSRKTLAAIVAIVASVAIVEHLSRALRMSRKTLAAIVASVTIVAIVEHLSRALRLPHTTPSSARRSCSGWRRRRVSRARTRSSSRAPVRPRLWS